MTVIPIRKLKPSLPRDRGGNPCFTSLIQMKRVLTWPQVLECVNRYLYQAEYQDQAASKYRARRGEAVALLKEAAKRLYPHKGFDRLGIDELTCVREEVSKTKKP
jgi:hypothetical protein